MARKRNAETSVKETAVQENEEVETPIEKVEAEVVREGVVTAGMLNVRSGPSMDNNPISTLYKGTKVMYTVENEEWVKLENGGFCKREYIK